MFLYKRLETKVFNFSTKRYNISLEEHYIYTSESDRLEHNIKMISKGYKDLGKTRENLGDILSSEDKWVPFSVYKISYEE